MGDGGASPFFETKDIVSVRPLTIDCASLAVCQNKKQSIAKSIIRLTPVSNQPISFSRSLRQLWNVNTPLKSTACHEVSRVFFSV